MREGKSAAGVFIAEEKGFRRSCFSVARNLFYTFCTKFVMM